MQPVAAPDLSLLRNAGATGETDMGKREPKKLDVKIRKKALASVPQATLDKVGGASAPQCVWSPPPTKSDP